MNSNKTTTFASWISRFFVEKKNGKLLFFWKCWVYGLPNDHNIACPKNDLTVFVAQNTDPPIKNGVYDWTIGPQRNCAVINFDTNNIGVWDDRDCSDRNCHVCAQGYGTLRNVEGNNAMAFQDFTDAESGVAEFSVDSSDDSDAVFLHYLLFLYII